MCFQHIMNFYSKNTTWDNVILQVKTKWQNIKSVASINMIKQNQWKKPK